MLQKIEVSLQQLVAPPSVSAESLQWATRMVNLFFGSFRKADADDPETFTAGCLRLFTAYPPEAVRYVVDPVTGLPGRSQWLPTMKEIRDALEGWKAEQHKIQADQLRIDTARRQIAEREQWQKGQAARPTLEYLREKYGPTWGLTAAAEENERQAKRTETLTRANRASFEAECEAAGVPPDSQISPTLAAMIRERG